MEGDFTVKIQYLLIWVGAISHDIKEGWTMENENHLNEYWNKF